MRKQQTILLLAALAVLMLLFFFGKTVNPNKPSVQSSAPAAGESLNFDDILNRSKQNLSLEQKEVLSGLEKSLVEAGGANKIKAFKALSSFWKETARVYEPYLFYLSEEAKLENSEKSLTFAAQQFTISLLDVSEPSIQNWLAKNGKVLFEKALAINPNNDSSKIGLGACYILGNISDNPMIGILPVREIATKNPDNIFAQMVLGLGGKKSGQFDKAIERFLIINNKQPENLVVLLHLAECYEMKGDKSSAKEWYLKSVGLVKNAEVRKEIEKRINELK